MRLLDQGCGVDQWPEAMSASEDVVVVAVEPLATTTGHAEGSPAYQADPCVRVGVQTCPEGAPKAADPARRFH
jgi:hypothetical protein